MAKYVLVACDSIIAALNMEPYENSHIPTTPYIHTMQSSGIVIGGAGIALVQCRMTYASSSGVLIELAARAEKLEVCKLIVSAIGG